MGLEETFEQIKNFDLADIDWNRMGVWPLFARVLIWIVACGSIMAATYFLFVKDLSLSLERSVAEEDSLRKTFETKAFQAASLEQYREQMNEMEQTFGTLVSQLPSDTEVPGLLEDIDEKGVNSGLEIESIELNPEVVGEFYVELPIEIRVRGNYHDLGSFISGIAGMPRIVTLHDFSIAQAKESTALDMTIQAKTYRYRVQEEG